MRILLACTAGMSTSLVEANIKKYAEENKIDVRVIAVPTGEAKNVMDQYDVVLLGPQVAFELRNFKKIAPTKPIAVIPGPDYAMGKAKEIYELAEKTIKDAKAA